MTGFLYLGGIYGCWNDISSDVSWITLSKYKYEKFF